MPGRLYGSAEGGAGASHVLQTNVRGRVGVLAIAALAVCAVAAVALGGGGAPTELQSSQTLQFGSGEQAVLSGRDFVPITNPGEPHTAAARLELRKLYAAAGMKMKQLSLARQEQLAEVPYEPSIKAHTQIDPGSDLRLRAAARGDMKAYSRRIGTGEAELQQQAERHALGDTIARYFASQQKT